MTVTVFTPTYNRAHTLQRTYESLCKQTNKDFEWLIIDDGSTDDTNLIVQRWVGESRIPIRYIHKENGGLHTAYNSAIENISSELCICCDSDDYLPPDAVDGILNLWSVKRNCDELAGIIGLDYDASTGSPIGGLFEQEMVTHFQLLKHKGDVKIVCRTDLMKRFWPMPDYGEKNFNPVWYYLLIDENYKWITVNKNLCNVDYQPEGMSAGIFRQYRNSPRSFAELRRVAMRSRIIPFKRKYINAAHYVSSSIFMRNKSFVKTSPRPFLTVLAVPLGIIIHGIVLFKCKNK